MHPARAAAIACLLLLTLFAFCTALVPIRADNDCWWHVKTGEYLLDHGIPERDVMSFSAADREWHNHEWLAQMAYALAYRAGEAAGFGGWRGALLANGVLIWMTVLAVYLFGERLARGELADGPSPGPSPASVFAGFCIAVLAVAIGRRMFYVRPPVMTNLMLVAELWLLAAVAEGWIRRRWLALLPPFFALWTNVHGGWMAGLVVLAAWCGEQGWARLRDRLPSLPFAAPPVALPLGTTFALGAACIAATLANPYGWRLYELPVRVLSDRELVASIGELQPPNLYFTVDFELWGILGAFALALFARRLRARPAELLLWLFFLHQAVNHVRHLSLFSIAMVPLGARLIAAAFAELRDGAAAWQSPAAGAVRRALPGGLFAAGAALMMWVLVNPREGYSYFQRFREYAQGTAYYRDAFPSEPCDLVELADLRGNMFNENWYAGYLIWRFAPERHRVFSDSRFDIFGGDIWREERVAATASPQWREVLDEYKVQWAIIPADGPLSAAMAASAEWAMAAKWPRWKLWIRSTAENAEMLGRARSAAPLAGGTPG